MTRLTVNGAGPHDSAVGQRIAELIDELPPLTDEDRRQAVAILTSTSPSSRSAAA